MILDTNALSAWADGSAAVREPLLLAKRLIIPAVGGGGTLYGIRQARAIPAKDAWIAALARQHDMPVLSNDRHFDEVDVLERIRF